MTAFVIRTNVELVSTRRAPAHRKSKYPWEALIEAGKGAGFPAPTDVNEKGFRSLAQKQGAARGVLFSVGRDAAGTLMVVFKDFRKTTEAEQVAAAEEAAAEEAALTGEDVAEDVAEAEVAEVAEEAAY